MIEKLHNFLIYGTTVFLSVYLPVETWISWGHLDSPGYICDVIAFLLLGFGIIHAIQVAPEISVGPLCAGWGFCTALFWRCFFMRIYSRQQNLNIYANEPGWVEQVLVMTLTVSFIALGISLFLATRKTS